MSVFQSSSSESTKRLGGRFAARVLARGPSATGATVFALTGPLGAGKTTFVQGFFKGLGLRRAPSSPTFILMRRTRLPRLASGKGVSTRPPFKNVYHVDAYRVRGPKEFVALGFEKVLAEPGNIVLVEWPERIRSILPRRRLNLHFSHGRHSEHRSIRKR